jgi:hypothetical protein
MPIASSGVTILRFAFLWEKEISDGKRKEMWLLAMPMHGRRT